MALNRNNDRSLFEGEIAGARAMQAATGAPEEAGAIAATTREGIAGELEEERVRLEAEASSGLPSLQTRFVSSPEKVAPVSELRPREADAYRPQQPPPMPPDQLEAERAAALARAKRTELKTLEWMADRGLSGVTQEDVDKFVAGQGDIFAGEAKEEEVARQERAEVRGVAGAPRKRAARIRAEMAFKGAMSGEDQFIAATDPQSPQAKEVASFGKVATVIDGGEAEIGMADLAIMEQAEPSRAGARADILRLKDQAQLKVREGAAAASEAIQSIQERPEWADMSLSDYRSALNAEIEGLDPIQKAAAQRILITEKPELIKQKEKQAAAVGAQAQVRAELERTNNEMALDLNKPDFRNSLIDSGIAPAQANTLIEEALTEGSEGSRAYAGFIADMRKKGLSVAYVTEDGVTVTTAKTVTPTAEAAARAITISGQTFQGKQLDAVKSIAPTSHKFLSAIRDKEIDKYPATDKPTATDVGTGRSVANAAFKLVEENKELGADAAIRQAAAEYATDDRTVDDILGDTSADINKRLKELSDERALTQFASKRVDIDERMDDFSSKTVMAGELPEGSIQIARTIAADQNLSQAQKVRQLDDAAEDIVNQKFGDDAKFASAEEREKAKDSVIEALNTAVSADVEMIQKAVAEQNILFMKSERAATMQGFSEPEAQFIASREVAGLPKAASQQDALVVDRINAIKDTAGDWGKQLDGYLEKSKISGVHKDVAQALAAEGIQTLDFPDGLAGIQNPSTRSDVASKYMKNPSVINGNPSAMHLVLDGNFQQWESQAQLSAEAKANVNSLFKAWTTPVLVEDKETKEMTERHVRLDEFDSKVKIERYLIDKGGFSKDKIKVAEELSSALFNAKSNTLVQSLLKDNTQQSRRLAFYVAMTDHFGNLQERINTAYSAVDGVLGDDGIQWIEASIPTMDDGERAETLQKVQAARATFDDLTKPVGKTFKSIGQSTEDIDNALAQFDRVRRKLGDYTTEGAVFTPEIASEADRLIQDWRGDLPVGIERGEVSTNAQGDAFARYAISPKGKGRGLVSLDRPVLTRVGVESKAKREAASKIAKQTFGRFVGLKETPSTIKDSLRERTDLNNAEINALWDRVYEKSYQSIYETESAKLSEIITRGQRGGVEVVDASTKARALLEED